MSSFLCDYETLTRAAHAAMDSPELLGERFHELVLLNADGYGQRYAHIPGTEAECEAFCDGSASFPVQSVAKPSDAHAFLALECVLYQAGEGTVTDGESYRAWEVRRNDLAVSIAHAVADAEGHRWGA